MIKGLGKFSQFFFKVTVFSALENQEVDHFIILLLIYYLVNLFESNELYITVTSGYSEN